jgi:ornithine cyclodeaminase
VIKIASGFWKNETFGIPNGQGMMLLFDQKTGQPKAILLDDATLTDIRTAVAGQICAQQFSNDVHCIGVLGTGLQARLQVEYLKQVTKCRTVMVWGRNQEKIEQYQLDMEQKGFKVALGESPRQVAQKSNLIITATASSEPMLFPNDILPGTHITAMGSDTPGKRELGPGVLKASSLVVADSIAQCQERGEIAHALVEGDISNDRIVELGNILSGSKPGRTAPKQITVADLTGVAVQDIQIAAAVFESYLEKEI